MSQMTFTIDTADTISIRALAALVDALTHSETKTQQEVPAPVPVPIPQQLAPIQQPSPAVPAIPAYQPASTIPTYQQPAPAAPISQPAPVAPPVTPYASTTPAAPNAPAVPAPESLPTTAPTYTLNQLSAAGTQLVDAGRRQEVIDLIHSYGVQMLQQIPPERYGEVATALRGMGAKI